MDYQRDEPIVRVEEVTGPQVLGDSRETVVVLKHPEGLIVAGRLSGVLDVFGAIGEAEAAIDAGAKIAIPN